MFANLVAAAAISVIAVHAPPATPGNGPAIMPTTLAFGLIDSSGVIPMPNGVPNAGTDNWDIAWPLGALARGSNYEETFSFQDLRYTGSCSYTVSITSKSTGRALAAPVEKIGTCVAGDVFFAATQTGTISGSPGRAIATLTIFYGKKQATFKVPLEIQ